VAANLDYWALLLLLLSLLPLDAAQDQGPADVWQQLMRQCAGNKTCQPLVINTLFDQVTEQQRQLAGQQQSKEQLQQQLVEQQRQLVKQEQHFAEQQQSKEQLQQQLVQQQQQLSGAAARADRMQQQLSDAAAQADQMQARMLALEGQVQQLMQALQQRSS
jgi:chromosome segregation ATPase